MHVVGNRSAAPDNRRHMRQRAVDQVGEGGLDDGVAAVGDIGLGGGNSELVKKG